MIDQILMFLDLQKGISNGLILVKSTYIIRKLFKFFLASSNEDGNNNSKQTILIGYAKINIIFLIHKKIVDKTNGICTYIEFMDSSSHHSRIQIQRATCP